MRSLATFYLVRSLEHATVKTTATMENKMKENVGTVDRAARSIVGPALVALGYTRWGGDEGRPLGLLAMMGGVTIIESAITRVCPINGLLGLDTREPELAQKDIAREFSPEELPEFSPAVR